jgi:hypothetical protein
VTRTGLTRASRRDLGGDSRGCGPYGMNLIYCTYCNQVRPPESGTSGRFGSHREQLQGEPVSLTPAEAAALYRTGTSACEIAHACASPGRAPGPGSAVAWPASGGAASDREEIPGVQG